MNEFFDNLDFIKNSFKEKVKSVKNELEIYAESTGLYKLNDSLTPRNRQLSRISILGNSIQSDLNDNPELAEIFNLLTYSELRPYSKKSGIELVKDLEEINSKYKQAIKKISLKQKEVLVKFYKVAEEESEKAKITLATLLLNRTELEKTLNVETPWSSDENEKLRKMRTEKVEYSLKDWFFDGNELSQSDISSYSRSLRRLEERELITRTIDPITKNTSSLQFTLIGILAAARLVKSKTVNHIKT